MKKKEVDELSKVRKAAKKQEKKNKKEKKQKSKKEKKFSLKDKFKKSKDEEEENLKDVEIIDFQINGVIEDNEPQENHKKIPKLKIIIFSVIAIFVIILLANYTTNSEFRNYIDTNILKKQVTEESLATVEIKSDDNPTILAFDSYVGILSKNTLTLYNSKASAVSEIDIDIGTPIYETEGKYVAIAENEGSKFYVINDNEIVWQGEVDGSISKININENGYVTVIASNSTYTSIVILFDSERKRTF